MASLGNISAKAVLDASQFIGETNRMAREHARAVRQMQRETKMAFDDIRKQMVLDGNIMRGGRMGSQQLSTVYDALGISKRRGDRGEMAATRQAGRSTQQFDAVYHSLNPVRSATADLAKNMGAARKQTQLWAADLAKAAILAKVVQSATIALREGADTKFGQPGMGDFTKSWGVALKNTPIIADWLKLAGAEDVKEARAADQQALDQKNALKSNATDAILGGWGEAAREAEFRRELMRMDPRERDFAENEKARQDELKALQDELDALRSHGELRADVLRAAREREASINREFDAKAQALDDAHFKEDSEARIEASKERERQLREHLEREQQAQQAMREQARAMAADYLAAASGTFGTEIGAGVNVESVDAINRSNAAREEAIQRQMLVALERIAANTGKPREGVAAP